MSERKSNVFKQKAKGSEQISIRLKTITTCTERITILFEYKKEKYPINKSKAIASAGNTFGKTHKPVRQPFLPKELPAPYP
ncbi:MAG: hypothetical protein KAX05_01785 [Bacteroidales bacterium]|nr:hypothetical protein [Bacteroidales bacterium]